MFRTIKLIAFQKIVFFSLIINNLLLQRLRIIKDNRTTTIKELVKKDR